MSEHPVTELRDERGAVVRVPTALLRAGMPPGFFDEAQRAREAVQARQAIDAASDTEVRRAREWSAAITTALDAASPHVGAA